MLCFALVFHNFSLPMKKAELKTLSQIDILSFDILMVCPKQQTVASSSDSKTY